MTGRWTEDDFKAWGVKTQAGCSEQELDAAESELGGALPGALRQLLAHSNGLLDLDGQWFVVWPLARIVSETTTTLARSGDVPTGILSFGDDGCGNLFCVSSTRPHEMSVWLPIASELTVVATGVDSFLEGWFSGEIMT